MLSYIFAIVLSITAQHGERIYQLNCTSCHATDPNDEGSVGPPIANSSNDLVIAKVAFGGYPLGYHPKRTTHIMPIFNMNKNDALAVAKYLQEVAQ